MDNWQTWLLLRPLIVFAVACPSFVVAALLWLRAKPSDNAEWTPTQTSQSLRFVLSASGVWRIEADGPLRPLSSSDPGSATQRRAA
jgi:hypothetical protein